VVPSVFRRGRFPVSGRCSVRDSYCVSLLIVGIDSSTGIVRVYGRVYEDVAIEKGS